MKCLKIIKMNSLKYNPKVCILRILYTNSQIYLKLIKAMAYSRKRCNLEWGYMGKINK